MNGRQTQIVCVEGVGGISSHLVDDNAAPDLSAIRNASYQSSDTMQETDGWGIPIAAPGDEGVRTLSLSGGGNHAAPKRGSPAPWAYLQLRSLPTYRLKTASTVWEVLGAASPMEEKVHE
jgi:hypothetical protein